MYGRSVSRQLTGEFVDQWKSSHPDGTVIDRDLSVIQIPPIDAEWIGAIYTAEEARTPEQKAQLLSRIR
jgi:FMN-dependent NADH-azoreductase